MVREESGSNPARVRQLVERQLPQLAERLRSALMKLELPVEARERGHGEAMDAVAWWEFLQQRYAGQAIRFESSPLPEVGVIPRALYDAVAENLLHNALAKRQREAGLAISIALSPDAAVLQVCDTGSAVREDVLDGLFRGPVASDTGFGIGLFNTAKLAEAFGYQLHLVSNQSGWVCFEMSKREGAG
jgi:C4-dicarboxylate-specific signal transduction histidine kinase